MTSFRPPGGQSFLAPRPWVPVGCAWLSLASGVAACAGGTAPPPGGIVLRGALATDADGEAVAGLFRRRVYGVSLTDEEGRPLEHPFLGGYNLPRPQWVDLDGDGDLDLFLQERSGDVALFEAVPTEDPGSAGPAYVWRTDRFAGLDVGEWYRFADMDGDGDPDLLTEERFSHIRLYRNDAPATGAKSLPTFRLATDTLRQIDGRPLFSDRQNIPNVADIDCDGKLDLLIGRLTGTVSRYEEAGRDAGGIPRFRLLADRFENIEIIGQLVPSLHGANTLAMADIDGDGDPDLFWGDFFEPGLLWIRNTGTCEAPSLSSEPIPFPPEEPLATSGYNAPTFGDLDGDGDLDLLVGVIGGAFDPTRTSVENLYLLVQEEDGRFRLRTRRFLRTLDVGSESKPALVDLDGDGDLDLVLGNKIEPQERETSRLHPFRNEGSAKRPAFRQGPPLPIAGSYHYAPAFGDLDGDGDPDLLLGSWRSAIALWRYDGGPGRGHYVLVDSAVVRLTRGSNATPALVDIDADGDLDLFVGESSGSLNYYRNIGSPASPRFELVSDAYADIDPGRRSAPAFADLDADGDLDLVIGTESSGLVYFRNDGSASAPRFVAAGSIPLPVPGIAHPTFGDLDGDGDQDLMVGGVGGGVLLYERR